LLFGNKLGAVLFEDKEHGTRLGCARGGLVFALALGVGGVSAVAAVARTTAAAALRWVSLVRAVMRLAGLELRLRALSVVSASRRRAALV